MTKVLIEVPDNLHRLVKTVASSKGETMKDFIIRAIQELVRQETKIDPENFNNVIDERFLPIKENKLSDL